MKDLRTYSNKELSLTVYSEMMRILDAGIIANIKEHLINMLKENGYKYNQAQFKFFMNDVCNHYDELRTKQLIEQLKHAQAGL